MTSKKTQPEPVSFTYVGGLAVLVVLPSGRKIELAPGDSLDALPSEVDALAARPDFQPATDTSEED